MTPEGRIEKHLKDKVQASGGKIRKLKWIGKSGAPDRLIWWPGKPHAYMAFVELKAPGKKPTKIRTLEHDALRADGFQVYVVDSIEAADAAILQVRGVALKPARDARGLRPATPFDKIDLKSPPNLPQREQDNSDLV